MVKLAKTKISKIQHRLNKNPSFTNQLIERPFASAEVNSLVQLKKFYVAQMDAATAHSLDHNGAIIVRFCDPGSMDMSYRNAKAVLKIEQAFEERARLGKDGDELVKRVVDFFKEHEDAPHIHIHCKYGEQRSVGFINGLKCSLPFSVKSYHFFKTPDGVRSQAHHLANMGNGSHYHWQLGREVGELALPESFKAFSEEKL